jgi:hypothetical protein
MAVVRARSSPPYGLFGAVAFAAIATAAAVILYVMWNKTAEERDVAQKNSALVATSGEIANLRPQFNDPTKTIAGQLKSKLDKVNDELTKTQGELDAKLAALKGADENVASLQDAVKAANTKIKDSGTEVGDAQQNFTKEATNLRDEIKKLNEQVAALTAEKDKLVKDGEEKLNASMDQAETKSRELVLKLEDAQSQVTKLNQEVRDLRIRVRQNSGNKTDNNVGEPDGRVVRVNGASGEVYINLGEADRISPGMPFTAYDPRTGVRFGSDEAAMGDGSLEVISVGKTSSICRITHTTKDHAIQNGDLISNIVYHNDKNRKYHFVVAGDFDLDGDGVFTAAERDRLIVLIKRWGGEVDNNVTSQTDYLVLGAKPKAPFLQDNGAPAAEPAAAPADATAPATEAAERAPAAAAAPAAPATVVGGVGETRSKEQSRYEDLEVAAKQLAIPVLNANRFLAMVGYYNTTVVRY